MAVLCRCEQHKPKGYKHNYTHIAYPLGYPNTSSICGRWQSGCKNLGLIYMTKDDYNNYLKGQRIFNYPSNSSQVKLADIPPIEVKK